MGDDDFIDGERGWFGRMFGGPWHVLVFPLGNEDRYTEYNGVDLNAWEGEAGRQFVDVTALAAIDAAEVEANVARGVGMEFSHQILTTFELHPGPPDFQGGEIAVEVVLVPPATGRAMLRIGPAHEVEDQIHGFDVTEGRLQRG